MINLIDVLFEEQDIFGDFHLVEVIKRRRVEALEGPAGGAPGLCHLIIFILHHLLLH